MIDNVHGFLKLARARRNPPLTIVQLIDIDGSGERDREILRKRFGDAQPDDYRIRALHDWAGQVGENGSSAADGFPYYPCLLLWKAMVICWDGQAAACCNDLCGKVILGDARRETLMEIWTGSKMVALRHQLIRLAPPALCRECVNLRHRYGANPVFKAMRRIAGGSHRLGESQ